MPYPQAWRMQHDLHAQRVRGQSEDTVLLVEQNAAMAQQGGLPGR